MAIFYILTITCVNTGVSPVVAYKHEIISKIIFGFSTPPQTLGFFAIGP
jgi:hypothetical protein